MRWLHSDMAQMGGCSAAQMKQTERSMSSMEMVESLMGVFGMYWDKKEIKNKPLSTYIYMGGLRSSVSGLSVTVFGASGHVGRYVVNRLGI